MFRYADDLATCCVRDDDAQRILRAVAIDQPLFAEIA